MHTRNISHPSWRTRAVLPVLLLAAVTLACSMPLQGAAPPPAAPTTDPAMQLTSQALAVQETVVAGREATVARQEAAATAAAAVPTATPVPPPTSTPLPPPTQEPTREAPTSAPPPAAPTVDVEARMKEAKILVYEDTQPIGNWIKQALDSAGYKYTHVGDAVGHFMEYLNSGITWDLIIVGAESKSGVRGEFWDAISDQVNRGAGLVAEIWYLDQTVNGRIGPLLTSCGIDFQRDLPLADSIYWLEPTHPVFNQPNTAMPLLHYSRYWANQAGDLIKLEPGGDAILLAGTQKSRSSDYGQIAVCMDGRVIFQTFSNHDYPRSDILTLWQNYVDYTLRSHFAAEE